MPSSRDGCYRATRMDTRSRWLALVLGAAYMGVGILAWLRLEPGADAAVPTTAVLLALWGATGILALGLARPDVFRIATNETGPWLALALAAPLTLLPLHAGGPAAAALLAALWPLSILPLGIWLGGSPSHRDATWLLAAGLTVMAVVLGIAGSVEGERSVALATIHLAALTSIALAPALVSARQNLGEDAAPAGRVLLGLGPLAGAVVLVPPIAVLVVLTAGLFAITLVNRATLRPLARAARQATAQRNLTVAAVEAERRRLSADIHDGPLQSLLLLGRRLEEEGHAEAAMAARTIALELRDVAGELRSPLLDDLGVGPALDWLADRAQRMSGMAVTVEYEGLRRPPPEVELAAFRIAQEALANAIRHGEAPIVVSYRTTGERLSLSVDDAGRGFGGTSAARPGSYGLLNMIQRAEQIGARLELLQRPDRGMHVGVEWSATT
jgi:signal transduction histidine kinase